MTTRGAMISRIEGEIYDTSLSGEIGTAIDDAIAFYGRKRFWFNQTTITFNTVADQEYYDGTDEATIPNIVSVLSMTSEIGGVKSPVVGTSFETIDAWQNGGIVGVPSFFTCFAKQIRLYRIPDQVYPIVAAVHYKLPVITDSGQGNVWYDDAEELIRTRAKRNLSLHKLWDVEMYARLKPVEDEALSALQAETTRRRSVNNLMTDYPAVSTRFDIRVG